MHTPIVQKLVDHLNSDARFKHAFENSFTLAYATGLPEFEEFKIHSVHDYLVYIDTYVLEGWKTFNEFFAREFKPGKRPIAQPLNDRVIVNPADFSSVKLSVKEGDELRKGQEISYFQLGGSDIVMIFQKDAKVEFKQKRGCHYKVGEHVADSRA
ncbi:hypothetical protein EXIGLDRAFT_782348 [Exidia glandulosa HHB12029]|uniref:Uncharacterized protein n=1 Tax=Exidia glandulosa HHB12029 TaxID=1314781 RepID=A0A165AUU1_EXIGL|nr:hypothetical protein EXIGLDRAFT_782348 [Exidia glandulosa HHB12029]